MTDLHDDSGTTRRTESSVGDESDVRALELDQLITDYFEAHREGRAPTVDDFVAQHPEHEHALRAVLPGASLLDQIGKRAEDATPQGRSGDRIGEYKLLGVLGRGGMGVVYEAEQETLGRPVALKVLPASRVVDRKSRERFMREAQAAASLQHPGIVPVYGVGEADGQVYYAMQRVDGVPLDVLTAAVRGDVSTSESSALVERAAGLAARLRAGSASSMSGSSSTAHTVSEAQNADRSVTRDWVDNSARVALQVAEALSYAHSRGVLHRDVKPSNVMLDESGRAYVTDFGLCKTADTSSLTAAGDVVGTLRYVPPERFQGRDDARGDVYGVGMILYELLCSRPAFPQKDRATLVQAVTLHAPPRPRKVNPDIPTDLERIVLTAIAKLPEERYASAEALMADLQAFLDGRPIRARAPGKLYLVRLFARRNRGLVSTAAAAVVVVALATVIYVRGLGELVSEVEAGRVRAERVSYHARLNAALEASTSANKGISRAKRFLDEIEESSRDWMWETVHARTETAFQIVDEGQDSAIDAALDSAGAHVVVLRDDGIRVHDTEDGEFVYEASCSFGLKVVLVPGSLDAFVLTRDVDDTGIRWLPYDDERPDETARAMHEAILAAGLERLVDVDALGEHLVIGDRSGKVLVFHRDRPDEAVLHQVDSGSARIALFGSKGRVVHAPRRGGLSVLGPDPGRVTDLAMPNRREVLSLAGAASAESFVLHVDDRNVYRGFPDESSSSGWGHELVMSRPNVEMVAISADGADVVTMLRAGFARRWTEERGSSPLSVRAYLSNPTNVLWLDGRDEMIVTGRSGSWCRVALPGFVQPNPGDCETRGHYSHCHEMSVDRDGKRYAITDSAGGWSIWDLERQLPLAADVHDLNPRVHNTLDTGVDGTAYLAAGDSRIIVNEVPPNESDGIVATLRPLDAKLVGLSWIGAEPGTRLVSGTADGRVILWTRRDDGATWREEQVARIDRLATLEHHRGSGLTLVGTDDGSILRADLAALERGRFEDWLELPHAIQRLGIGTLGEVGAAVDRAQRLHVFALDGPTPRLRWTKHVAESGIDEIGHVCVAIDEDSGWVITAGADGVVQTWDLVQGLLGPTLATRYGRFSGVVFPEPGSPPITLEYRGRVTTYEASGAPRVYERLRMNPADHERAALDEVHARTRLEFLEEQLERVDLTDEELRSMERMSGGLAFYGKFFAATVDRHRCAEADKRIRDLRKDRASIED